MSAVISVCYRCGALWAEVGDGPEDTITEDWQRSEWCTECEDYR